MGDFVTKLENDIDWLNIPQYNFNKQWVISLYFEYAIEIYVI